MKLDRVDHRGWDVVPSFVGEGFLSPDIFREVQEHPLITGESSWGTRNLIHSIILSTRPRTIVEIGAHIGACSLVIGSALRANGYGKSYHLEPQEHYYAVLRDFITRAGLADFAYALQMLSTNPLLPAIVDHEAELVFVDANHSYSEAYQDLIVSEALLASRGLIIVEDVGNSHSAELDEEGRGGVRQAVLDFVNSRPDFSVVFLEWPFWLNPTGLALVARKPSDQNGLISVEQLVAHAAPAK